MANKPYRYHMAANIYNPLMRDELKAQYTRFEVLQGKISAIISDSDIQKYQDGSSTWYSAYSLVAQTVTSLNAQFSEFKADYDEDYSNIDSKVAEYKASVDEFSATLSHVKDDPEHYLSGYAAFKADVSGIDGRVSKVERTIENDVATTAWTEEQLNIKEGDITASVAKLYISGVTVQYAVGDSASNPPTSGWSASTPQWTAGKYIWQRTAIVKDGQTTYSNTTCIQGATGPAGGTGPAGADGYTVLLSNESHTFAGSTTAAIAASTTCDVIAYKGTTRVATTIGSITGAPNGMSTSIASNGSTSAKITISVTTSMVTKQGTLTIPITVDGKSFTRNFSYSLALAGGTGADAYTIILTNESYTFPGTDTHAISDSVTSEIYAYKGTTRVAASIGTISGKPSGMTTSISGSGTTSAKFTVSVTTDLVSKSGTLSIPLTIDGKSFTKQFSYTLALAGTTGAAAVIYDISLDNYSIVKNAAGTLQPASVTATSYSRTGTGSPTAYSGYWRVEYTKNGTDWTQYGTSSGSTYSISVSSIYTSSSNAAIAIRISLYKESGRTTLLDRQTIPIVADGENPPIYEIVLSNAVVIKDKTDAYSPSSISARAYKRTGSAGPSAYSDYWKVEYTTDGTTWSTYNSPNRKDNITIYPSSIIENKSVVALKVSLYWDSARTSRLLDSQTIPVVMDGKPGAKGVGVASIKQQWYLSTSDQTQTGGNWVDTPPAYKDGYYYWQKSVITYTDGTPGESTPILDREFMDLEIRMTTAEQTITDAAIVQTVTGSNGKRIISKGETILEITNEGSKYKVSADYIDLNGLITANGYFKITQAGSPEITGGNLGGWVVTENQIYSELDEYYKITLNTYAYDHVSGLVINGRSSSQHYNVDGKPVSNSIDWALNAINIGYDGKIVFNSKMYSDSKGSSFNPKLLYNVGTITIYKNEIDMEYLKDNRSYQVRIWNGHIFGYDGYQGTISSGNPCSNIDVEENLGLDVYGKNRWNRNRSIWLSAWSASGSRSYVSLSYDDFIVHMRESSGNAAFHIESDSNIYIEKNVTAKKFITSSDRRLKENIKEVDFSAMDFLNEVPICSYDWIETKEHVSAGIIAQDLQNAIPELVQGANNRYLAINQIGLIPYMIKALQEIDAKAHSNRNELNTIWNNLVEIAQAVTELQKKDT